MISCASMEDGVEATAAGMTQPMKLIAGSTTPSSFLIDAHLFSCFFLLFAWVSFPDVCYEWEESTLEEAVEVRTGEKQQGI